MSVSGILKSRKMLFCAGAVCGGLGVWVGQPAAQKETAGAAARPIAASARTDAATGREIPPPDTRSSSVATVAAVDTATALAQINDALLQGNPIERSRKFIAVLGLMNESNGKLYLDAWLEHLRTHPPIQAQGEMMNRRLGQIMGGTVVASRTGTPYEMKGTRTWLKDQFLGWMETDPGASWKWLDGLKNEQFREVMAGVYLESAAQENPAQVVAVLNSVPPELQSQYGGQVGRALRATKPVEEVSRWISEQANAGEETRNSPWLRAATDALMESVSNTRYPGASVAQTFEQHLGEPGLSSSWGGVAARQYANEDPVAGLQWVASMMERPEFVTDTSLIGEAIGGIREEKLAETVKNIPFPEGSAARDSVLSFLAQRLNSIDPNQAAAAAALIQDPALRPVLPDPSAASDR